MNKLKLLKQGVILFLLVGVYLFSCSKMDDTYKAFKKNGDKRYSKIPDSIMIYPGYERIKMTVIVSDPNIDQVQVYWNFKKDSIIVPFDKKEKGKDSLSFFINNLKEGTNTFNIFTVDKGGNLSVGLDTSYSVYGQKYESKLVNRKTINSYLLDGKPRIQWATVADPTSIGTEVKYTNQNKKEKTVYVKSAETNTNIDEKVLGDSISYRTLFLPDSLAIDTIYGKYESEKLEEVSAFEIKKDNFKNYFLPGDATPFSGYDISNMWNGKYVDISDSYKAGSGGDGLPLWITFDLGQKIKLARYRIWQFGQYHTSYLYGNGNLKEWEIWGSNDPDSDGSWDSWTKILACTIDKPSGKPVGENTQEDIDKAVEGNEFDFPDGSNYRYIRIKALDTWKVYSDGHFFIQELSFYGVPLD